MNASGKGVAVLVPAAGLGARMKTSVRKTFLELDGVPILIHALRIFNSLPFIDEILPIVQSDDRSAVDAMLAKFPVSRVRRTATGGPQRQDSVRNGFDLLPETTDIVLVHDAVRPFATSSIVKRVVERARTGIAVVPGVAVKDTVKQVGSDGLVEMTLDRSRLVAIQTPQAFPYTVLRRAYETSPGGTFLATDEAALVERNGSSVSVVEGDYENIKITTPDDLDAARAILARRMKRK